MTGTIINAAAIIAGSSIGLLFHAKLAQRFTRIVFQGIGLFTLVLGFSMAVRTAHYLIIIFSVVIGAILGELIDIEKSINRFADYIKKKSRSQNSKFSEGLITASLLYCVGSMAILGAIEEGLGGKPNLLLAKSVLDGFSSIALTAGMGIGVAFSVVPLMIYQGGLTLFSGYVQHFLTEPVIDELTAVGGILLIGLGINILEIGKISVINMLPALAVVVILAIIFI
ncbi:DUF554 family protein [candidate division KSB1 bacterium]|nr:DUF554 family protein [candidate division KSB1 bacterium]